MVMVGGRRAIQKNTRNCFYEDVYLVSCPHRNAILQMNPVAGQANQNNHIPGPAGTSIPQPGGADHPAHSSSCCHQRLSERPLEQGEVVTIVGVTRGIAGEVTLLLRRKDDQTTRASVSRAAVQKLGPLRAGDMILIEMEVHPISSSHYNPMRLVCLGSDTCSRAGALKDEQLTVLEEDNEEIDDKGGRERVDTDMDIVEEAGKPDRVQNVAPQLQPAHRTQDLHMPVPYQRPTEPKRRQIRSPRRPPHQIHPQKPPASLQNSEFCFELDDDDESTLCPPTQSTFPKPTATVASVNLAQPVLHESGTIPAPASTWHTTTRPKGSMNADLYNAFTDDSDTDGACEDVREDEDAVTAGINPSTADQLPLSDVPLEARLLRPAREARPTIPQPPHLLSKPQDDQDDDLLAGLDDPF